MIVKMKFISITGPKNDIDRVIDQYLSKYEIQLENTLTELKSVRDIRPYIEINPYRNSLNRINTLVDMLKPTAPPKGDITIEETLHIIQTLETELASLTEKRNEIKEERERYQSLLTDLLPFRSLNYDIEKILHFRHIKFRFGKISQEYHDKFEEYVYDALGTLFFKCESNADYVWGVYFVPASESHKVDAVYSSLRFERIYLKDEYKGTPGDACRLLEQQLSDLEKRSTQIENEFTEHLAASAEKLLLAQKKLSSLSENFDVRRLAACTVSDADTFYILCGWMSEQDTLAFSKEIELDDKLYCIIEDDHSNIVSAPPTKLKNLAIFRPFEVFTRMYGLPSYHESDPTMFVALTYAIIFGAMFGDVGQGLFLCLGGAFIYKFKKAGLAAVISLAGIFSTFFGFMYGSVFGFEDIISPLWLRPISHMTRIPFIGNLNTVFLFAIAFGMFLIIVTMILNIINGIKTHDWETALFGKNGIAGLIFYAAIVFTVILFVTGKPLPGSILLTLMFALPLLSIFFKEPLMALIEKKSKILPKEKGMFLVQGFFELFEVLLSYFSNTLSFVRIGAFAISHAAMMQVVLMLAGAENGASPNWVVVVLGNLFVCGMEGLIVGIQVLRLEYYEFFSRFYQGSGREFKPYAKKKK